MKCSALSQRLIGGRSRCGASSPQAMTAMAGHSSQKAARLMKARSPGATLSLMPARERKSGEAASGQFAALRPLQRKPEGKAQFGRADVQTGIQLRRQVADDAQAKATALQGVETIGQADTVVADGERQPAV